MKNKILLVVAGILILIGFTKPDLSFLKVNNNHHNDNIVVVTPPSDASFREVCAPVTKSLLDGPLSRKSDGKRLASLYLDLATLIELDGENQVIKSTGEIRQANSLSGVMLQLNIKDKYPGLAENSNAVIVSQIGEEDVVLDANSRLKASEAFRGLAWACSEGAK